MSRKNWDKEAEKQFHELEQKDPAFAEDWKELRDITLHSA